MTIDLVAKYIKIKARAEGGSTDGERQAARSILASLEEKYPGLGASASRVSAVIDGEENTPGWQSALRDILAAAAGTAAADFGSSLTEPDRTDRLKQGQIIFTAHECRVGQVCLEVRVRNRDILSRRYQSRIFDRMEDELREMAMGPDQDADG